MTVSLLAVCLKVGLTILKIMTMCHNAQIATLFSILGFSHVLLYTPFSLNFNALHFRHSDTSTRG